MDPDAAVRRIREIINNYDKASDEHELASELVDLVSGLDQWLSKGGHLPYQWGG